MKHFVPYNKQSPVYNRKYAENLLFAMELYKLAKISYYKEVPMLPKNDVRRNVLREDVLHKPHSSLRNILSAQLHLITPIFKRTAA